MDTRRSRWTNIAEKVWRRGERWRRSGGGGGTGGGSKRLTLVATLFHELAHGVNTFLVRQKLEVVDTAACLHWVRIENEVPRTEIRTIIATNDQEAARSMVGDVLLLLYLVERNGPRRRIYFSFTLALLRHHGSLSTFK